MPEQQRPAERTAPRRAADHASLMRLSETLVPALIVKLNASGLGELEVREGDWSIRLRRSVPGVTPASPGRRSDRPRHAGHAPERDGRPTARETAVAADDPVDRRLIATSPAVGVFRAPASLGTRVRAGDRVGIVDLLGIPQDVVAPADGTLVDILVQGGEAVEYGEPIAVVETDDDRAPGPSATTGEG